MIFFEILISFFNQTFSFFDILSFLFVSKSINKTIYNSLFKSIIFKTFFFIITNTFFKMLLLRWLMLLIMIENLKLAKKIIRFIKIFTSKTFHTNINVTSKNVSNTTSNIHGHIFSTRNILHQTSKLQ